MFEPVDESSMFWFVVTKISDVAYYLNPWILLVATALWALRVRSWPGYLGLMAGILVACANVAHLTTPEVRSNGLGEWLPLIGENPIIYFLYMHGWPFGNFLLAIALVAEYARRRTVA